MTTPPHDGRILLSRTRTFEIQTKVNGTDAPWQWTGIESSKDIPEAVRKTAGLTRAGYEWRIVESETTLSVVDMDKDS